MIDVSVNEVAVGSPPSTSTTNKELNRRQLVPAMISEGIGIVRDESLSKVKKEDKIDRLILQSQLGRYDMAELMNGVIASTKARELKITDMELLSAPFIKTTHEGLSFSLHNQDAFDKSVEFMKKLVVSSTPPADIKNIPELRSKLRRLVEFFSPKK